MNTLDSLLQLIAPHHCVACGREGRLLCRTCQGEHISFRPSTCYRCNRLTDDYKTCRPCRSSSDLYAVYVVSNYESTAKQLVHAVKFGHKRAGCSVLGSMMSPLLARGYDYIVPLPTAAKRVRRRGFDQAVLLAEAVSEDVSIPMLRCLRRHGSERQLGATRLQRIQQLRGAFRCVSSVGHANILLVDDVVSTGASIEAAASVLKKRGAKRITAIVFARA